MLGLHMYTTIPDFFPCVLVQCASFLFYFIFIFVSTGILTQSLTLVRQVLYHLAQFSHFCFSYFSDRILVCLFFFPLGASLDCDTPPYSILIAGITGIYQNIQLVCCFFPG
jgi:hypothetical protein